MLWTKCFEEPSENEQWGKVKQTQPVWPCILSGKRFEYTLEKLNKCSQCNYASSQAGNLRTHLKTHSGERSYKCNQCDYESSQANNLAHLKIYSGEKSNKCDQLDFASSYKSALIEDTYEKRQRRNFKTNAISLFNDYACSYASQICKLTVQKRGKMQPRWQGIAGFCAPQQIPQSFCRARICKFLQQKNCF